MLGVGAKAKPITAEALRKMRYLKACVKESMRLTPSGAGLIRVLEDDIEISGYNVPAGTQIMAMQWTENKVCTLSCPRS